MWDKPASAAQPCDARLSEARQIRTLRYTCAGSASGTKQGFAWRRDQPECACPGGKSLPLAIKPNAGRGGSQMGAAEAFNRGERREAPRSMLRSAELSFALIYWLGGAFSLAEAGTALVLAQSRKAAISSARVIESGTVCDRALRSDCVASGFFSEYAA